MKSRLLLNILTGYVGKGLGMALGIVLVPFLIHKLGKESFGLVIMAESMIALIEIVSTSVRSSIAHHTTLSLAQEKKKDFVEYLSTGRRMLWIAAAAVLAAGLALSYYAPAWLHISPAKAGQVQALLMIMTISFSVTIPNIIYWSVLYAHQRLDLISLSGSTSIILRAVVLFAAFSVLPPAWVSLATYGAVYLIVTWAKNTLIYRWHKKVLAGEKIPLFENFSMAKAREMLSYTIFYTIGQFSYVLYENVMGMILFFFWGPAANAVYSVSYKLPSAMERLYEEPTWALTPTITGHFGKNETESIRVLLYAYTKIACLTVVPVCFTAMFFSDAIMARWVGEDFGLAAQIMPLHMLPLVLNIPFSACYCVMSAAGKVKIPGLLVGPSLALMIAGGLLFSKVFGMGLYGIVLSECLVGSAFAAFFLPAYCCRVSGLSLRRYWVQAYLGPFLWAASATLGGLAAFYFGGFEARPVPALALASTFSALYAAAGFALMLDRGEKDYCIGLVRRVFNRLSAKGRRM